jgi:hypothetical protein
LITKSEKFRVSFKEYDWLHETPLYWQNFVHMMDKGELWDHANKILENEYHGKMIMGIEDPTFDYLEFDTEEDFIVFRLKWS